MVNKPNLSEINLQCPAEISSEVWTHILYKARAMVGTSNLYEADFPDLVQTLAVEVLKSRKNFKPELVRKSEAAYYREVVNRQANKIYRGRMRAGIDDYKFELSDWLKTNQPESTVSYNTYENLCIQEEREAELRQAISEMPKKLREVWDLLMEGKNCEETGRILGVKGVTVRTRRIPAICDYFRQKNIFC